MKTRWEHELRSLDDVPVPLERIRERAARGPATNADVARAPSRRKRVTAGAVALAIFALAGVFAWRAFGGAPSASPSDPDGTIAARATMTLLMSSLEYPGFPQAALSFDGVTVRGQVGSYDEWRNVVAVVAAPSFEHPVRLPVGTSIDIGGDAEAVSARIESKQRESLHRLELDDRVLPLDVDPGRYFLRIEATWDKGTVPFYFPIAVVPSTENVGQLAEAEQHLEQLRREFSQRLDEMGADGYTEAESHERAALKTELWEATVRVNQLRRALAGGSNDGPDAGGSNDSHRLVGPELAEALGISPHPDAFFKDDMLRSADGSVLEDCDPDNFPGKAMVIAETQFGTYCVTADTKVEAWEFAERLQGHIPSPEEVQEMEDAYAEDG